MLVVRSVLVLMLAVSGAAGADPRILGPGEAFRAAADGRLLIIDLRSPAEWRETGVPRGALPISLHRRGGLPAFYEAVLAAAGGDRRRPIALICASGGRSSIAQRFLAASGFPHVIDISAGVLGRPDAQGWIGLGLPIDPCPTC